MAVRYAVQNKICKKFIIYLILFWNNEKSFTDAIYREKNQIVFTFKTNMPQRLPIIDVAIEDKYNSDDKYINLEVRRVCYS